MATLAYQEQQQDFALGRVFGRGFEVLRAWPLHTLGLVFVLTALPSLAIGLAGLGTGQVFDTTTDFADRSGGFWIGVVVGGLVIAMLWLVAFGAVVQATVAHGEGRRPDMPEMLRVGLVRALPVLAVYFLYWFAVTIGLTLLFVPGVILAIMWSQATTAIVVERPGVFGAFGRSRALTKGARWKVFGVCLVVLVVYMLVATVSGVLGFAAARGSMAALDEGASTSIGFWIGRFVGGAVNTLVMTWAITLFTALFLELRAWKEGPDTQALADIFA